ncbi:MAG: hypothetical protein ACI9KE_000955 [Polyangiales bacterium]|jgi:hypothetical protein
MRRQFPRVVLRRVRGGRAAARAGRRASGRQTRPPTPPGAKVRSRRARRSRRRQHPRGRRGGRSGRAASRVCAATSHGRRSPLTTDPRRSLAVLKRRRSRAQAVATAAEVASAGQCQGLPVFRSPEWRWTSRAWRPGSEGRSLCRWRRRGAAAMPMYGVRVADTAGLGILANARF